MERNFYDDEFEDFLKEKADQYTLYPSDRAWHGIYTSLHSGRKWYTAAGALLLIATLFLISLEIASSGYQKAARNIVNDSISSSRSVTSAKRSVRPDKQQIVLASNYKTASGTSNQPQPASDHADDNTAGNTSTGALPATAPATVFRNPSYPFTVRKVPLFSAPVDPLPPHNLSGAMDSDNDAQQPGHKKAMEEKQMKEHQVNWLREMAVLKLKPNNKKYYHLQFYVSPGASYRRLKTDKSNLKTMSSQSPASGDLVNLDGIVNHQPSFGLEAGTALLFDVSDRFVLKAGLQLNYVKYNISAYRSSRERTAITLSRANSNIHDTITSYSSIRNLGGRFPQELQNQYVQISLPIGAEVKLLGNKRFQFNVSGTLQPTYLLYSNTYLLTSDYENYIKQPGLVRKWNVNAAVEPYISYSTGNGLRWQLGPQFRYQLLSSYSDRYPVREFLIEYGVKIGVSKTLR